MRSTFSFICHQRSLPPPYASSTKKQKHIRRRPGVLQQCLVIGSTSPAAPPEIHHRSTPVMHLPPVSHFQCQTCRFGHRKNRFVAQTAIIRSQLQRVKRPGEERVNWPDGLVTNLRLRGNIHGGSNGESDARYSGLY